MYRKVRVRASAEMGLYRQRVQGPIFDSQWYSVLPVESMIDEEDAPFGLDACASCGKPIGSTSLICYQCHKPMCRPCADISEWCWSCFRETLEEGTDAADEASLAGRYAEAKAYVEELEEAGADSEEITEAKRARAKAWREYQGMMVDDEQRTKWGRNDVISPMSWYTEDVR